MMTMMMHSDVPSKIEPITSLKHSSGEIDDKATPHFYSRPDSSKVARVSSPLDCVQSSRKVKTELPAGFKPGPYSVVLGRGKVNDYTGNRRLKVFATLNLPDYVAAKSRREKSYVVARVMETVQQCNGGVGAFVRLENGTWYEVEEATAREKIGVVFRDLSPAGSYRSSTKSKVARRRQRKTSERHSPTSASASTSSSYCGDRHVLQPQDGPVAATNSATLLERPRMSIVNFDFSSIQHILTIPDSSSKRQSNVSGIGDDVLIDEDDYGSLSDNTFAAHR